MPVASLRLATKFLRPRSEHNMVEQLIPRNVRRVALRQWLTLTLLLLSLTAALGYQNGLVQLDQPLYDLFMRVNSRPARDDIIIVGIDDYSISQLGRWPWSRTLHAQLLNNIMQARPLA